MKSLSHVQLFATSWTVACQAPPSIGFSRQEYWSGLPFPSPGYLPNPGKRKSCNSGVPLPHPLQSLPIPTPTPTTHPYMQDHSCLDQERFSSNSDLPRFPFHMTPFLHLLGTPLNRNMRCKMYHQGNECLQMAHPWISQPPLSHSCSSVICMGVKTSSTGVGLTLDQDLESGQASE